MRLIRTSLTSIPEPARVAAVFWVISSMIGTRASVTTAARVRCPITSLTLARTSRSIWVSASVMPVGKDL